MAPAPAIPSEFLSVLTQQFGLRTLLPAQKPVLAAVADGAHVLAVLPTGAGKSLCFQLPAAAGKGLHLCISPLIALMRDQVLGLRRRGIAWAGAAHSLLNEQETERVYAAVRDGRCRLLYVAPERLRSRRFWQTIQQRGVERLIIDEAHCLSAWGHDFRPDYRLLPSLWETLGKPQVLAFTATAGAEVRRDLQDVFPGMRPILARINRPNLRLSFKQVAFYGAREAYLAKICEKGGPAIVYTASRRDAEELAGNLVQARISAAVYHAGVDGKQRNVTQQEFLDGKISVVVATTAFGMGVDKRDIRHVVHAGVPFGVEHYWQEVGRAGRDGRPSAATALWSKDALKRTEFILEQETPTGEHYRCAWRAAEGQPGLPRVEFDRALDRLLEQQALGWLGENARSALLGPLYHSGAIVVDSQGGHHPGPRSAWKHALTIARRQQKMRRDSLSTLIDVAGSHRCRLLGVAEFLQLPADPCGNCDNCRRGPR